MQESKGYASGLRMYIDGVLVAKRPDLGPLQGNWRFAYTYSHVPMPALVPGALILI